MNSPLTLCSIRAARFLSGRQSPLVGALSLLLCLCFLALTINLSRAQETQGTQELFGLLGPLHAFDATDIIASLPTPPYTTSASNVTAVASDAGYDDQHTGGSRWRVWGQGRTAFAERKVSARAYDAEVQSYLIGADYQWRDDALMGLMFVSYQSQAERMAVASTVATKHDIDVTLNGLIPYINLNFGGIDFFALAGAGQGEVEYRQGDGAAAVEVDADMQVAAVGIKSRVLLLPIADFGMKVSVSAIKLSADAPSGATNDVSVRAYRARLALTARRDHAVAADQSLTTHAELGGRIDAGDDSVDKGSAVDIKLGLDYYRSKLRLGVGIEGRWEVTEQDNSRDLASWGTGLKVYLRPDALGRGLSLMWLPQLMQPQFGGLAFGDSAALVPHEAPAPGAPGLQQPRQPQLSLGYSWWARQAGLLTAYAALGVDGMDGSGGGKRLRLGARLHALAAPLQWSLYSDHHSGSGARNALGMALKLGF